MTRQEEIDNAKTTFYERVLKDDYYYDPRDCFEEGAQWADANTKSPWISVEKDLPCNHDKLINGNVTYPVFVRDINNIYGVTIMMKFIKWDFMSGNITHWMPIPKLPKE